MLSSTCLFLSLSCSALFLLSRLSPCLFLPSVLACFLRFLSKARKAEEDKRKTTARSISLSPPQSMLLDHRLLIISLLFALRRSTNRKVKGGNFAAVSSYAAVSNSVYFQFVPLITSHYNSITDSENGFPPKTSFRFTVVRKLNFPHASIPRFPLALTLVLVLVLVIIVDIHITWKFLS